MYSHNSWAQTVPLIVWKKNQHMRQNGHSLKSRINIACKQYVCTIGDLYILGIYIFYYCKKEVWIHTDTHCIDQNDVCDEQAMNAGILRGNEWRKK